jgi:hypothetical protein
MTFEEDEEDYGPEKETWGVIMPWGSNIELNEEQKEE